MRLSLLLVALLGAAPGACCPDPHPQGGGTKAEAGAPGTTTLATLQKDLFDRHCVTDCHEGPAAGSGLQLGRGRSWASLVSQPSQEITTLLRVAPGRPAASYLVRKLVGGSDIVGDRMPKNAPLRPQTEVDQVAGWITRGAPDD